MPVRGAALRRQGWKPVGEGVITKAEVDLEIALADARGSSIDPARSAQARETLAGWAELPRSRFESGYLLVAVMDAVKLLGP